MPSKRTTSRAGAAKTRPAAKTRAAVRQPSQGVRRRRRPGRFVAILGAGADQFYGIPTVAQLLPEIAEFSRTTGRDINKVLRSRLGRLQFSFDKHAADRGSALITDLFSGGEELIPTLRSVATKAKGVPAAEAVAAVFDHLCNMAEQNQLSADEARALAALIEEKGELGDVEPLLDPTKITLSSLPGQAFRHAYQLVFRGELGLSTREQSALEFFVTATSNIEELLSLYFMRFSIGTDHDRKVFAYLLWMLWAFLWVRSANLPLKDTSIHVRLPKLGADIVTFNYTTLFDQSMLERVHFFHGRLDEYLRLDTRDLIRISALSVDNSTDAIVEFIEALRLDASQLPEFDIPAIVPPTSFKPVMSRRQLRCWLAVDDLLQNASRILIVGYSFATADEHFNDLLRHASATARVVIVNPDALQPAKAASRILGLDASSFVQKRRRSWETFETGRLLSIAARAEDVSQEMIDEFLPD